MLWNPTKHIRRLSSHPLLQFWKSFHSSLNTTHPFLVLSFKLSTIQLHLHILQSLSKSSFKNQPQTLRSDIMHMQFITRMNGMLIWNRIDVDYLSKVLHKNLLLIQRLKIPNSQICCQAAWSSCKIGANGAALPTRLVFQKPFSLSSTFLIWRFSNPLLFWIGLVWIDMF